jgi:hypothetical protein
MIVYHVVYRDERNYRILDSFVREIDAISYLDKLCQNGISGSMEPRSCLHIEKIFNYQGDPEIIKKPIDQNDSAQKKV